MPTVTATDLDRMRDQLFFDGPEVGRKQSRFWVLLLLAGAIASAGVVGDSTATVIGAMIVAPLMVPILGIVLSIVLADRANLVRSVALVVGGAASVVALGFLMGTAIEVPVLEATNGQVAARVSPRLIDLVAALATGAVGAYALCRADISDTLPGVAIAISLVPPLAVVGLTLESGSTSQAAGALLLFTTNVAAILATGVAVMALHGVHRYGDLTDAGPAGALRRGRAVAAVVALVVLVGVPLSATSTVVAQRTLAEQRVASLADDWADAAGWEVVDVSTKHDAVVVRALGDGTQPDPAVLRAALDRDGLDGVDVRLELIPETTVELSGS
jgi:uncharacterized hydrophobic protein (TIGR00271 family)